MQQVVPYQGKRIRVPVVANYAYALVNQFLPLPGLPLDIRTDSFSVGTDGNGRRFQVNKAMLHFPGLTVIAQVRSWEDAADDGTGRKSLQHVRIESRTASRLPIGAWQERLAKAWDSDIAASLLTTTHINGKVSLEFGSSELDRLTNPIYVP